MFLAGMAILMPKEVTDGHAELLKPSEMTGDVLHSPSEGLRRQHHGFGYISVVFGICRVGVGVADRGYPLQILRPHLCLR